MKQLTKKELQELLMQNAEQINKLFECLRLQHCFTKRICEKIGLDREQVGELIEKGEVDAISETNDFQRRQQAFLN